MKTLAICLASLTLAACATTGGPSGAASRQDIEARIAPTRPAQLADATARELAHLARFEPDTLDRVYPELRALAAALVGAAAQPAGQQDAPALPVASQPPSPQRTPRRLPDTAGATSVLHAVHLASYRGEETALRGWAELQAAYPVLAGLDARLELAHIPEQGDFLRLKAGPFDTAADARAVCEELQAAGQYCMAAGFAGQPLDSGA
jgi:cell division septation protein DedD